MLAWRCVRCGSQPGWVGNERGQL